MRKFGVILYKFFSFVMTFFLGGDPGWGGDV